MPASHLFPTVPALVVALALLIPPCAMGHDDVEASRTREAAMPAHGLRLPATFRGDLPCADCAGVRYHLDLWPDQVYHLRREWSGTGKARDEIGRWRVDPARRALLLEGGGEMPLQFEIQAPDHIRALNLEGKPIESQAPHDLRSDGRMDAIPMSLFMGGEVTRDAGTLLFDECITGRRYAVAAGSEAQRLEREYDAHSAQAKGRLYVSFDGTLAPVTTQLQDGRTRAVIDVERFVAAWPNQSCERSRADAALANTYWRIVQLHGAAVAAMDGRREPHILLRQTPEESSFSATVGCNTLVGRWERTADALAFKRGATTLMACPAAMAERERDLQQLLDTTVRWQQRGNVLVLQDEHGATLALLEAVYF